MKIKIKQQIKENNVIDIDMFRKRQEKEKIKKEDAEIALSFFKNNLERAFLNIYAGSITGQIKVESTDGIAYLFDFDGKNSKVDVIIGKNKFSLNLGDLTQEL